jgi:hypothetical protein
MGTKAGLADRGGMPSRRRLIPLIASAALLAPAAAHAMDEQDYWAFADRLQARMDRHWSERAGYYTGTYPVASANALLVHAVAARRGHDGPARNDAHARRLVTALTSSPPFIGSRPPRRDSMTHWPGFVSAWESRGGLQHPVFDAEILEALAEAWRSRRALDLSPQQVERIVRVVHGVAMGSFYRWPAIALNQINWYANAYGADTTVTGNAHLLRRDLRLQIARFAARAHGSVRVAGNLGPGLHFHYLPHMRRSHPMNVDSAEYANITASFLRVYQRARHAGMAPPSFRDRRLLREWLRRVLAGYWTHAGYVNWDTGFGFRRWHQAKKFGLSQQALLGIATAPGLAPNRRAPAWAKWMLDRGFEFYERELALDADEPGVFFGVHKVPQSPASALLALSRVQSNAARAVAAGLGARRAVAPPPLYSFDPDTGRLAVTTRDYNTAVVPTSRGAFPYGGIELARLFDGRQSPVGGIGGKPPAAFGLLVRDISGHRVVSGQTRDRGSLRLVRAPLGVGARASVWTGRAYAGSFRELRAAGVLRGGGVTLRTRHRFTSRFVETAWTMRAGGGRARHTTDVLFPSTGGDAASVVAVRRDGSTFRVGTVRRPLARVSYLYVRSRRSGYVVVPRAQPRGATVHLLHPRPQSSAPYPGPTLAVQLGRESRRRSAAFRARLAPAGPDEHAVIAARLMAR